MPKTHRAFRLSEPALQALAAFAKKWNVNSTDALEKILVRWRYLDDVGFTRFTETMKEEIACTLRVQSKGLFYCMYGTPKNVKLPNRFIETLDICVVCKTRKLGLSSSSFISPMQREDLPVEQRAENPAENQTQSQAAEEPHRVSCGQESSATKIHNPNVYHEGMIYCRDGGFWVFPAKCDLCKTQTYPLWYNCENTKHARQGEEERQQQKSTPTP